jgi:hypothetical protein
VSGSQVDQDIVAVLAKVEKDLADGPSTGGLRTMRLPRNRGAGRDGCLRVRIVGGVESLSEAGAERAVGDGAADLKQQVGAASRPAHLLRFVHPTVHQEVGRTLGQRRADPQSSPASLTNQSLWPVRLPFSARSAVHSFLDGAVDLRPSCSPLK